jgi:GxxExxY protein
LSSRICNTARRCVQQRRARFRLRGCLRAFRVGFGLTQLTALGAKREFREPENRIAADVAEVAYKICADNGPGMLESAYTQMFCHLLRQRGHDVKTEVAVTIEYEGLLVPCAYRIDVLVDDLVVIELKSLPGLDKVHFEQLLTYIKLARKRLGMLINFGAESMEGRVRRIVDGLPEEQ